MRAISSKLNIYVKSITLINNNVEKFLLQVIFWSFGTLLLFYIVFLGNMVKDIVERRSLEGEARILSSEVRNLELSYLSLSNNVDLALSQNLGFKETKAIFATHKSLGLRPTPEFGSTKVSPNDL